MEEYVDELEGLAESLSDDGHVEINANIDVEKKGLAAYGRHWLQAIVNCMAQKETRKQFNIAELQKFSGISEVAIVPT
ncbi:hypothetical protein T4B_8690 [Trichinella pseudospiralis]|uniref:Uncharacterized protein n=1 Tax=Trichinella pseudospiralis TaxID=6337 RepID=A0A0V1JLB0_TRIPS|nr:hypothetical protein T4B_8690 [Trichinella pseudospiralis]KRZ35792.1 hypothetical protein T4C_4776 [Trichinella pseudospiralis]